MDVLVFGATGFIGRWVAEGLRRAGAKVHIAARAAVRAAALRDELQLNGKVVAFDAADARSVLDAVAEVRPCVAFNLVGYGIAPGESDAVEAARINGDFVRVLCRAVAGLEHGPWPGAALVHAGTQREYGPIGGSLREDVQEAPDTLYGRTKLEGTRAVRGAADTGTRAVSARLFNVYGPGEPEGRLLPSLMAAAAAGRPVALTAGLQQFDFVYVADVAEGLLRLGAAQVSPGLVVNLATGVLTPVRDFAVEAADALGMPRELLRFGELPARAGEMRYEPVDNARMRRVTGWTPATTVPEGIRRTLREMCHVTG